MDDLQQAAVAVGDPRRFLQQLRGVVDRRQRVADLVREAGGEAPEGGQGQRFRAPRDLRGVVEEHQREVAVAEQSGEARQHLGLFAAQPQRQVGGLAVGAPRAQPPRDLGRDQLQAAAAGVAEQRGRGLVGELHVAVVVDQQHPRVHAPDDQLVDRGQVGELGAAALGQGVAVAHLPAEHVGEHGDGEEAHREHQHFGERPRLGTAAERVPHVLGRQRQAGEQGAAEPEAQRHQQRRRADVEQQQQGDARRRLRQGMGGQGRGEDVDRGPDQHLPAQAAAAPVPFEQGQGREQVQERHPAAEQREARLARQHAERAEQHQRQQRRLEYPVEAEEIHLAAQLVGDRQRFATAHGHAGAAPGESARV